MLVTAKERLRREPQLRRIENWPVIPADQIPKPKRARFRQRLRAVSMALADVRYGDIAAATGIGPAQITRLLDRALVSDEDETPPLTRALIPNTHVRKGQRRRPLSTLEAPCGSKGAFSYLLETVPELKTRLDRVITAALAESADGENLTPQGFHSYFLLFLEQAGHPATHYPYTEDSLGYESARCYLAKRKDALQQARAQAKAPKWLPSGDQQLFEVGREIQIDEQTYDGEAKIYLEMGHDLLPVRVGRFSVLVTVDADSSCVLGFRTAYTQACSQFDVLSSLHLPTLPTLPTTPATLNTPGIVVPEGPCFPNQLPGEAARIAFNSVALDNALAHCVDSVTRHICDVHGGTVSLGLPAAPKVRRVVESAIGLLSRHAKRFKSTSGSHPHDPLREPKRLRERPPRVTVAELEEAIYAVLARHNRESKPYLAARSPLDVYRRMLEIRPLRLLPPDAHRRRNPFELEKSVPVKWLKADQRAPHINFLRLRYTGACLSGHADEQVTIVYDYRDIRELTVYGADGVELGTVRAPKSWQRYPRKLPHLKDR